MNKSLSLTRSSNVEDILRVCPTIKEFLTQADLYRLERVCRNVQFQYGPVFLSNEQSCRILYLLQKYPQPAEPLRSRLKKCILGISILSEDVLIVTPFEILSYFDCVCIDRGSVYNSMIPYINDAKSKGIFFIAEEASDFSLNGLLEIFSRIKLFKIHNTLAKNDSIRILERYFDIIETLSIDHTDFGRIHSELALKLASIPAKSNKPKIEISFFRFFASDAKLDTEYWKNLIRVSDSIVIHNMETPDCIDMMEFFNNNPDLKNSFLSKLTRVNCGKISSDLKTWILNFRTSLHSIQISDVWRDFRMFERLESVYKSAIPNNLLPTTLKDLTLSLSGEKFDFASIAMYKNLESILLVNASEVFATVPMNSFIKLRSFCAFSCLTKINIGILPSSVDYLELRGSGQNSEIGLTVNSHSVTIGSRESEGVIFTENVKNVIVLLDRSEDLEVKGGPVFFESVTIPEQSVLSLLEFLNEVKFPMLQKLSVSIFNFRLKKKILLALSLK
jgi:hypothetical protein